MTKSKQQASILTALKDELKSNPRRRSIRAAAAHIIANPSARQELAKYEVMHGTTIVREFGVPYKSSSGVAGLALNVVHGCLIRDIEMDDSTIELCKSTLLSQAEFTFCGKRKVRRKNTKFGESPIKQRQRQKWRIITCRARNAAA